MPYRKQEFFNDGIYHIVLRGLDENLIFKDINDYYRGIFSIYEFNNAKPVSIKERRKMRVRLKEAARGRASGESSLVEIDERDKIVGIWSFCFMPNHIHLLLKQIKDGGITKFMSKVGTGYGGYFNRRYNRKGYVFQDRFYSVHIKDDEQLKTIFTYIHTNSISLVEPAWKEEGIRNPEEVIRFLEKYKWSSHQDYIGIKNFPSVTEKDFMLEIMGGAEGCKNFVKNWILYKKEINKFKNLFLEP